MKITKTKIHELLLDYGGIQKRTRGEIIYEIQQCFKNGKLDQAELCFWFLGFSPYVAKELVKHLSVESRKIIQ